MFYRVLIGIACLHIYKYEIRSVAHVAPIEVILQAYLKTIYLRIIS